MVRTFPARALGPWVAVGLAVVSGAACDTTTPRPSLATCASAWTPITPMNDDLFALPRAMAWQDGVVYQATLAGVMAMPTDGGQATTLAANGPASGVWVEGDQVLYSTDDRLFEVPRAGGDVTTLLDGGQHNDPSTEPGGNDHIGERQLLDSTAFTWTTRAYPYTTDGIHAWRLLREGGAVEGFALLPIATVDGLAVTSEGVLAVGESTTLGGPYYRAFLAPFARGAARELSLTPMPDGIVAAEPDALLASVYTGSRAGRNDTHEIWRLPVDGSASTLLSHNLPVEFLATWSVPDQGGGHFLGGVELFDDGETHGSVFQVDHDGNAVRLACDASDSWPLVTATAVAPDALYASVRYDRPAWVLLKLSTPVR